MNTKTSISKYRILVLMDLSKASEVILKNAVQLAKMINGNVEIFHVKAPTDVVTYENQYSAIRAIHEDHHDTKSKLRKIVRKIKQESGIMVTYQIDFGNIKKAIKERIDKIRPEIILLGKRKPKLVNFMSNGITNFVLKHCPTNILIVGEDHKLHTYKDISLGVYGEVLQQKGFEIVNDLNKKGTNPIKFFKIRKEKELQENNENQPSEQKMVSYIFSEGENALEGLASYVSKTDTQLFCIPGKPKKNRGFFRFSGVEATVKHVIQKLDVPVLILK